MKKSTFKSNALTVDVYDYMFVEWLVRHGLYSKFVTNFLVDKPRSTNPRAAIREHIVALMGLPHFTLSDAISSSFTFWGTPEGTAFWLKASVNWRSYLKSFSTFI